MAAVAAGIAAGMAKGMHQTASNLSQRSAAARGAARGSDSSISTPSSSSNREKGGTNDSSARDIGSAIMDKVRGKDKAPSDSGRRADLGPAADAAPNSAKRGAKFKRGGIARLHKNEEVVPRGKAKRVEKEIRRYGAKHKKSRGKGR